MANGSCCRWRLSGGCRALGLGCQPASTPARHRSSARLSRCPQTNLCQQQLPSVVGWGEDAEGQGGFCSTCVPAPGAHKCEIQFVDKPLRARSAGPGVCGRQAVSGAAQPACTACPACQLLARLTSPRRALAAAGRGCSKLSRVLPGSAAPSLSPIPARGRGTAGSGGVMMLQVSWAAGKDRRCERGWRFQQRVAFSHLHLLEFPS